MSVWDRVKRGDLPGRVGQGDEEAETSLDGGGRETVSSYILHCTPSSPGDAEGVLNSNFLYTPVHSIYPRRW